MYSNRFCSSCRAITSTEREHSRANLNLIVDTEHMLKNALTIHPGAVHASMIEENVLIPVACDQRMRARY